LVIKITWRVFVGIFLVLLTTPQLKLFYFNAGLRWQYILVFSFFTAHFAAPICLHVAVKLHILDRPNWRKRHHKPTPLLGGLSVYIALTSSLLLNGVFLPGMEALLFGATLIFIMGLWDDIRQLPALLKFILQLTISLTVILWGNIHLTFFMNTSWAHFFNVPLTLLWIVGLTNAMNFFDGVDGLASSLCIISAIFLGILSFNTSQPALGWFAIALLGACIGFLPFNFRLRQPALLFLGDAGSTFLGFTLAGLAVLGEWSNTSRFASLTAPVLIFGVLIFDMVYINMSRIKNREANSFFELLTCVNRDHLHHRLMFMGFSGKEVVFIISTISTCLGVSALIIMNQNIMDALLGLFQALLIIGVIVSLMLKGRDKTPESGDRRVSRRRTDDRK